MARVSFIAPSDLFESLIASRGACLPAVWISVKNLEQRVEIVRRLVDMEHKNRAAWTRCVFLDPGLRPSSGSWSFFLETIRSQL